MRTIFTKSLILLTLSVSTKMIGVEPGKQSIFFKENKGQVCDQNGVARPDVLFSGNANGLAYNFTKTGISYQLNRVDKWKEEKDPKFGTMRKKIDRLTIYRVDMKWINANQNLSIKKGKALPGYENYYLEHCKNGALGVKNYEDLTFINIYPGINAKWYEKQGAMEFDLVVAPNSKPEQIKLEINGAQKLVVNDKGELVITTPLGTIIEKAPIAYQGQNTIAVKWKLNDNVASFQLGAYDHNAELIIDPVVRLWGTYYGGSSDEYGRDTKVDPSGNVYICSETNSSNAIATTGSFQTTIGNAGTYDGCLAKFNTSGARLWATYAGGTGADYAYGCATDPSGNVYLTGATTYSLLATAGAHQTSGNGALDAYLIKFNASGVRLWGTLYGSTQNEYGYSCVCDASGNVFMGGETSSPTSTAIATASSHQPAFGGGIDGYFVKFNGSGVRQWATYYGSGGTDKINSCSTDASGESFFCGETTSTISIASAGFQNTYGGGTSDAFLVKLTVSGGRVWGTYYGGSGNDYGYGCATDNISSGNVYLVGQTSTATSTIIATINQTAFGGSTDAFVAKFSPIGARDWGSYYGGTAPETGFACTTNLTSGDIYISGETSSATTTLIATSGSHQTTYPGNTDAFLAKLSTFGVRSWGSYYGGGTGRERGYGIARDASGNIFMGGETWSTAGINTTGAYQTTFGGITDCFLAKFYDCQELTLTIAGTATVCSGSNTNLTASGTGFTTYTWSTGPNTSSISVSPTINTTYTLTAGTATSGCNYSDVQTVTVIANPTVGITASSPSVCSGSSTSLTASGASTYSWSTGATTTVTSVSPIITTVYTATGTAATGCKDTQTISISVTANPTVNITASSPSLCSGSSTSLTASGASTYSWSTGATTTVTTVSPSITTVYTATGTAVSGCKDTQTISISVTANPTVAVTASSPTLCSGSTASLTASGASTYSWSTGGTGTSVSVSPTITTVYTATGTAASGCKDTQTISINVTTTPTLSTANYTICSGGTATLSASGATTYSWSTGATTTSITVTPTANATYTVTGNNGACQDVNTVSVTVGSALSIAVTPTAPAVCIGNSGTLTASGATSYTWSTGSNSTTVVVTPTTTTTYTISGTSGACSGSRTIAVTVNANPTVNVTSSASVICTGNTATLTGTGANTYNWNPGSLTGAVVAVSPTLTTTYSIVGTSTAGCTNTKTISVTVSPCTGIAESQNETNSINVYPNPNNGQFNLTVPETGVYMIINSIGQTVETIEVKEGSQVLSIEGLADGIYYVIGKSSKAKIVVSK